MGFPHSLTEGKKMARCNGVRFNGAAMDSQDAKWYEDCNDAPVQPSVQVCYPTCMESITPKESGAIRKRKFPMIGTIGERYRHKFQRRLF